LNNLAWRTLLRRADPGASARPASLDDESRIDRFSFSLIVSRSIPLVLSHSHCHSSTRCTIDESLHSRLILPIHHVALPLSLCPSFSFWFLLLPRFPPHLFPTLCRFPFCEFVRYIFDPRYWLTRLNQLSELCERGRIRRFTLGGVDRGYRGEIPT